MNRFTLFLTVALISASAFAVESAQSERCAALATAADRIVCYDRQFPPDNESAAPTALPEPIATTPLQPPPSVSVSQPPVVVAVEPESAGREPSSLGLVPERRRGSEQSSITAIRRREHQNTVFLLANEQIWLQDSDRGLPFRVGDAVTIKSGTFGGYFLTSEKGTTTRVRRIK